MTITKSASPNSTVSMQSDTPTAPHTTQITQAPTQSTCTHATTTTVSMKEQQGNQRLQLYNSLFGQEKNKICDKTRLQLTSSFNYSLYTFLHLSDKYWVLSLINIESFDILQEKNMVYQKHKTN